MKTDHLTQEFIHRQLDSSQAAVEAALLSILERQTAEERAGFYTREANGVGFSKWDAEICTSFCHQLKMGKHLTPRQLEIARKKTKRYWRQLVTVMTTEAPVPAPEPITLQQNIPTEHTLKAQGKFRDLVGSW